MNREDRYKGNLPPIIHKGRYLYREMLPVMTLSNPLLNDERIIDQGGFPPYVSTRRRIDVRDGIRTIHIDARRIRTIPRKGYRRNIEAFFRPILLSLGEIELSRRKHRDYSESDVRKKGHTFEEMGILVDISEPSQSPHQTRLGAMATAFGEIGIPKMVTLWEIDCDPIPDPLRPDQSMVSAISQEIALAAGPNPSFTPYVRFDYIKQSWAPSILEHESATVSFKSKMGQYRPSQPTGAQKYRLYRLRPIFPASICEDVALFLGGRGGAGSI